MDFLYHTFPDGRRERIIERCTLRVTFIDGQVVEFPDTAYLAIHRSLGYTDPIFITGTTVEIENMEQSITLLGVRFFTMEFPG